jgi:ketosteroid isomerase-like protein
MEDEIAAVTAALVLSLAGGDAAGAAGHYSHDAWLLGPAADFFHGRSAIEAYWRAGVALGPLSVDFGRRLLESVDDEAVEAGRYEVAVHVTHADLAVDRGTYLVLHRRTADGLWRRAVEVFTPDEPTLARPDTSEEEQQ